MKQQFILVPREGLKAVDVESKGPRGNNFTFLGGRMHGMV